MHRNGLIAATVALACGVAHAGIHIEVSTFDGGPDGFDSFGAIIGQTDTLSVWVWSDEPGVRVQEISFDLIGTVFGSSEPNGDWFEIQSLGMPDPEDRFNLFAASGVLTPDGSRISGVTMVSLPFAGSLVDVPVGPGAALPVYAEFTGRPHVFTGGVLAANVTVLDENFQELQVTSHGWYQIPAPGPIALLLVAACPRRRRASHFAPGDHASAVV